MIRVFTDAYRHGQGSYRGGHHGGHRRGQRRHGYIDSTAVCVEKGGECMDRSECKTDTSLITVSRCWQGFVKLKANQLLLCWQHGFMPSRDHYKTVTNKCNVDK